jgi:hypothetical protein
MALAWWLVLCLPFPGLPNIYFLFTVRLRIFHVCRNENFRNSYLSFYWKKWFDIWYMALAWWLVPCLPFPGLPHIYFLFTVRLTNEWVGVFLARRSVQHFVIVLSYLSLMVMMVDKTCSKCSFYSLIRMLSISINAIMVCKIIMLILQSIMFWRVDGLLDQSTIKSNS